MCDDSGLLPKHIGDLIRKINDGIKDYTTSISPGSSKGDNYLGDVIRVKIKAVDSEKSFIVKRAPVDEILRETVPINLFYKREIYAYSSMLPKLFEMQAPLPQSEKFGFAKYFDGIVDENKETAVLEDLSQLGFTVFRTKLLDRPHLEFVVKTLAQFHATSFVLKKKNPKLFEELSSRAAQELEYGDMLGKVMEVTKQTIFETMNDKKNREMIDIYLTDMMEKFQHFVDPKKAEPYNVLCHGDCWTNNCMFLYENDKIVDMRFLDWQIIRLASPITDIAYMMYSSTDQELRSECTEKILDLYYETLKSNVSKMGCDISECYPEKIFREHVNMIMPFGLITSVMKIPESLCDDSFPDMN